MLLTLVSLSTLVLLAFSHWLMVRLSSPIGWMSAGWLAQRRAHRLT
jgi:hypothetical protein